MTSVWDDPAIQSGNYYSFKDVPNGTSISGTILEVSTQPFTDNGATKVVPVLKLKDDITGEECALTAGAYRLRTKLIEIRPNVGDHIKVTQTGSDAIGGGKFAKNWEVVVNGSTQFVAPPAAAPVAEAPAPSTTDIAGIQQAFANLTPEERARLNLPVG